VKGEAENKPDTALFVISADTFVIPAKAGIQTGQTAMVARPSSNGAYGFPPTRE